MSGVCSAGFATTALPAASAPATCPVKIASGKFQGEMQANTPRPCKRELVALAGRALELERRRKAAARLRRRSSAGRSTASRTSPCALPSVLPASRTISAISVRAVCLEQIGGAVEDGGAGLAAEASQS